MSARWWRSNRWWLVALPVTFALMLVASSYRVKGMWWDTGFHHQVAKAAPGRYVHAVDHFEDAVGKGSRSYAVRLSGLTEAGTVTDSLGDQVQVPRGMAAYEVGLDFRADPHTDMNYCQVFLLDDRGRRYGGENGDPLDQANICVPDGHPGPQTPLGAGSRRGVVAPGEARPPSWSVHPVVLVPRGVKVVAARVAYTFPDYVTLPVPSG